MYPTAWPNPPVTALDFDRRVAVRSVKEAGKVKEVPATKEKGRLGS
jgi:hypothetical protein